MDLGTQSVRAGAPSLYDSYTFELTMKPDAPDAIQLPFP